MDYDPLDSTGDPFGPPTIPTLVFCLHCQQEYESYGIEWRIETDHNGNPHGYWCCPIPECGGRGFGCDIFPVDPDYRGEDGEKMWIDDDDEEEYEDGLDPLSGDEYVKDEKADDDEEDEEEALPW